MINRIMIERNYLRFVKKNSRAHRPIYIPERHVFSPGQTANCCNRVNLSGEIVKRVSLKCNLLEM
jgi:hypothetical protein